jgi:hypothetical protein
VPGAQVTLAEREFIKQQAEAAAGIFDEPVFVNIGIMWGCTMWCLRAGSTTAKLYGVDIAPSKWEIKDRDKLRATILQGDSRTMAFDLPIHVLFVDGDHHYGAVRDDIANWTPRVAPEGVVIFHDYAPALHNLTQFPEIDGVRIAVDEWRERRGRRWIEVPSPDSLRTFLCQK